MPTEQSAPPGNMNVQVSPRRRGAHRTQKLGLPIHCDSNQITHQITHCDRNQNSKPLVGSVFLKICFTEEKCQGKKGSSPVSLRYSRSDKPK